MLHGHTVKYSCMCSCMCACVCVCVCVCNLCAHVCSCMCASVCARVSVCKHTREFMCNTSTYVSACASLHVDVHACARPCVSGYLHVRACMSVHVSLCVHLYVLAYAWPQSPGLRTLVRRSAPPLPLSLTGRTHGDNMSLGSWGWHQAELVTRLATALGQAAYLLLSPGSGWGPPGLGGWTSPRPGPI